MLYKYFGFCRMAVVQFFLDVSLSNWWHNILSQYVGLIFHGHKFFLTLKFETTV